MKLTSTTSQAARMTLTELKTILTSSEREDWLKTGCWGAFSGPSYRDKLIENRPNEISIESHGEVAAFKPNLAVTMAWGLHYLEDFREPWANAFPDGSATGCLA